METKQIEGEVLAPTAHFEKLPAGYEWIPDNIDERLDPKIHLDLKDPSRKVSLESFGYPDDYLNKLPTRIGQSSSFQILSAKGKEVLKRCIAAVEPHAKTSPRIPRVLRGGGFRSKFLYDLTYSKELADHVSQIAGIPLVPHPMMIQNTHINYKPLDANKKTDKWHMDTVAFVVVLFCTDPETYEGGQFEYFDGTLEEADKILKAGKNEVPVDRCHGIGIQHMGWGIFQQGSEVLHHVTPVTKGNARTTLVLSFESARISIKDACSRLADTYNEIDPYNTLFPDWVRFRCWRGKQRLKYLLQDHPDTKNVVALEKLGKTLTDIALSLKYTAERQFFAEIMGNPIEEAKDLLSQQTDGTPASGCLKEIVDELQNAVDDVLTMKESKMIFY